MLDFFPIAIMPILSIVAPEIPAEGQDKFLANLPAILSDIKSQPGVAGVTAGQIVGQDGVPVTDFKFVHAIGGCWRTSK